MHIFTAEIQQNNKSRCVTLFCGVIIAEGDRRAKVRLM